MYLSDSWFNGIGRASYIILMVLMAIQLGCAGSSGPAADHGHRNRQNKAMDARMTTVTVKIISSKFDVLHDDFVDGSWDTQYLTKVEILDPSAYRGGELTIAHRDPPATGSVWVERGKQLQIEVEDYVLDHPELMIPAASVGISTQDGA